MINHLQLTENSLIKKFKPKDLQLLIDHSVYHSPEDSETDLESEKSIIVVKDLKWRSSTVNISFDLDVFVVFYYVLTILTIFKLRSFLRDYIDRLRAEETNSRKLRERIIGNNFSNNTLAPLLAPRWTRAGYSGRLRDEVIKACYSKYNQQHHEETTESQYTNPNYETSLNDNAYAAPKQGLGDLNSNDTPPDKPRNQIENQRNDQNQPDSRTYNDGYDADVGEEEEEEEVLLTSNDQPVNQNTDDDNLKMDDWFLRILVIFFFFFANFIYNYKRIIDASLIGIAIFWHVQSRLGCFNKFIALVYINSDKVVYYLESLRGGGKGGRSYVN